VRKVTVTGNIVSRNGIVLFFADGTSEVLPSESFRTQGILDTVLPRLARMETAEIDLDAFSIASQIEKATNGAIKVEEIGGEFKISTKNAKIQDGNALRKHVEDIIYSGGNGKGLKIFLEQFAAMSKDRKHTSDELLKFLERADLPLADDGSIIGYKMLNTTAEEGIMVDPHTRKVRQKLGSLVFMPASKVDDDRRQLCSTGLHIARRDYIPGWYSNERRLCLVKIHPTDVIAVPLGETSKMRVCAYHIVKVFDAEDGKSISQGTAIESLPKAAKMLADAIAGNHTLIVQRVKVGANGEHEVMDLVVKKAPRKAKKTRAFTTSRSEKATAVSVSKVKAVIAANLPYEKKLAKAQKDYDDGMSIRDISKKHHMDRESLGKNLKRVAGR
jgi:hypothetical protein